MSQESVLPENKERAKFDVPFKPASWLTKIDFINHLILFNNKLISVVAEQGGGKSTFVSLLKSSLDASIRSHVVKAVAPFTSANFLMQLSEAFHLRKDIETTVSSVIQQINERKAHVLLIIDDAQHLPDGFIQQLLPEIKKQGNAGFFHLCLVSDYSIAASLNSLDKEFFDNSVHSIELGPLNEAETKTFLLRYLPAPKRLDKTMTDKRLAQFYDLTGGKISRINALMVNFFDAQTLTSVSKSRNKSIFKSLSRTAIAAAVLSGCYYLWQHQEILPVKFIDSSKPATEATQQIEAAIPGGAQSVAVISEESNTHETELASYIADWTLGSVNQLAQTAPKRSNIFEFDNFDEEDENDAELAQLVEMDKVVVIPKPQLAKQSVEAIAVAQNPVKPANLQLKSSLVAINTNSTPVKLTTPIEAAHSSNPNFTIQLLASRNKEDLTRFLKNHSTLQQAKILKVQRPGMEWFILTFGQYNKQEDAKKAMSKLAEYKPWVRPMAGLSAIG